MKIDEALLPLEILLWWKVAYRINYTIPIYSDEIPDISGLVETEQ